MDTSPLPPTGLPGLDWAARSMPLLAATMRQNAEVFGGRHVGICLHIEPKTAVLVQWLLHAGATITITGNLGTTDPDTHAALARLGANVIGDRADTSHQHANNLTQIVAAKPDLLLDNGGAMIELLARGAARSARFAGATEETTTGGRRIRQLGDRVDFPVIVINDSYLKLLVENEFGVGQSIVQGFMNATNMMLPGTQATVFGYGPCGKGVADTLQRLGARVSVIDPDPFRALEAIMHGHQVGPIEEVLPQARLVFLATGHPDVLPADAFRLLSDGAIIAGVGHEPYEIDLSALTTQSQAVRSLATPSNDPDARTVYQLDTGAEVTVLHSTKMINLVAATGNPIQAMDLGLSLQASSLGAIARGHFDYPGPQPVPRKIDQKLAAQLVSIWR